MLSRRELVAIGISLAVISVLPFVLRQYFVEVLILFLINVIVVASFRLMTLMGYYSLAHIVMMGVGAYTAALLARNFGVPFWALLPIGGAMGAVVSWLLSYPLVRMRGAFAFFIGSFAVGEAIRIAWIEFRNPFGGSTGLINIPPPVLGGINFGHYIPYYFMTLGVVIACLTFIWLFDRSRIGDTLRSIASQDVLSSSVGINLTKYKTLAIVMAGFFAAMAGVLLVHRLGSVDPKLFGLNVSLYLLIWVIIGGARTFAGPIIGLGVITVISEALRGLVELRPLVLGAILILFMLFLPGGLESIPEKASAFAERLRKRTRRE